MLELVIAATTKMIHARSDVITRNALTLILVGAFPQTFSGYFVHLATGYALSTVITIVIWAVQPTPANASVLLEIMWRRL